MDMSNDVSGSQQASFLHPRDPSIINPHERQRAASPVRKQLFSSILLEEVNSSAADGFQTYLRVKPTSSEGSFSILGDTTVVTKPPPNASKQPHAHAAGRPVQQFTFSHVFGPRTSQKDLFDHCVSNQLKGFILGQNCLLFAYGTTNAGKTFTIQGTGEHPGIIPRALDSVFKSLSGKVAPEGRFKPVRYDSAMCLDSATIALDLEYKNRILQWNWNKPLEPIKASSVLSNFSESDFISSTFREMQRTLNDTSIDFECTGDVEYGVWVSFAEVYNESVFDLLGPMGQGRKRVPLKLIQEDGNVFVKDLRSIHVSSGDEAFHVMLYGKANLKMASTNMNHSSSRSHCIFTIQLVRYFNTKSPTHAHVSSFSFCDLAGAERAKKTLNVGDRLRESNNINTSLHVLGRCIMAIRENQEKREKRPIPFRDSKLTRLLQGALTGNSQMSMIVNASPAPILFDETFHVLKFSAVARQIIFEPPIRKQIPKPNEKKSRFSMLVFQPKDAPIHWDSVNSEDDYKVNTHKCANNNQELLLLVDSLTQQLKDERSKNITLERNVRQEITANFSKIMSDMDNSYKSRLRDIEERNLKTSTWRLNQLEDYYREKLEEKSRKRRRESDLEDDEPKECKIKDLEEEIQQLESKNKAVQQFLVDSKEQHSILVTENSKLKFELCSVKKELDKCQRALQASQQEVKGDGSLLLAELQNQLSEEKKKLEEEKENNKVLKLTLDEARDDFLALHSSKDAHEVEISNLQQLLITKDCEIAELKSNLENLQFEISQKSQEILELEDKLDVITKEFEALASLNASEDPQIPSQVIEDLHQQLKMLTVSNITATDTQNEEALPKSPNSVVADIPRLMKMIEDKFLSDADLTTQYHDVKDKLSKLSEEFTQKDSKVAQLSNELETIKIELKQSKDTALSFESQLTEKQSLVSKLEEKLSKLCAELSEKDSKVTQLSNELETIKIQLQKAQDTVRLFDSQLKDEQSLMSKITIEKEEETDSLQKELKSLLRENTVLKKTNDSLLQDKDRLKSQLSAASNELETGRVKVATYEKNLKLFDEIKENSHRSTDQANRLRDEIEELKDQLKNKESEMDSFEKNREMIVSRYEEALKKAHEDRDMHKREALQLRKTLFKSTPTPNKTNSVEAHRNKDNESSTLEKVVMSEKSALKRQTRNAKKGLDFSLESLKETCDKDSASYMQKLSPQKFLEPPLTAEKPQRRQRRQLFSKPQVDEVPNCDVVESDSSVKTNPETYMRRLRSSKKP